MFKRSFLLAMMLTCLHGGECNINQYGEPPILEGAVEPYMAKEEIFTLSIPQGWSRSEEGFAYQSPDAKTVGIQLKAHADEMRIQPEISAVYYQYGGFFTDYRDYIRLKRLSFDRQDDDNRTSLSEVNAGGKKGVAFLIRTVEATRSEPLFKPGVMYRLNGEMMAKMIPVFESFRVFPAERGFFVFYYKASDVSASKCEGVFERLVQSVRFINPEPWQGKK